MLLPKNKAFTLIELLIVISIMTILTGAMIPSFVSYMRDQNIKQALEQVKSDLRTIQNNALTDSLPPSMALVSPMYWGVSFTANSSDYYYFVTTQNNSCDPGDVPISQDNKFVLPNSIVSLSDYCLFFDFSNGNSNGSSSIAVTDTKSISCLKVNSVGLVSIGTWNSGGNSCD